MLRSMIVFLLVTMGATANADAFHHDYARRTADRLWSRLEECGLIRMNPRDPRLPMPQIPADEAVVNSQGQVLAYFYRRFGGGCFSEEFKAPNGGLNHHMDVCESAIGFTTPYAGTVARASTYVTPDGKHHAFHCRSGLVSAEQFDLCVERDYVQVIAGQLCRYP